MTIAGNQGQNLYPDPENYPDSSFPQPVPAPDGEPDDAGTLITVQYSWLWREVLMAAVDQLRNPATWQADHDENILALNRATNLKDQLQRDVQWPDGVPTPYWDDENDVDDQETVEMQTWYGRVSNPTAPAGSLDFIEDASIWVVSGMVALATGSVGVALAFRTFVRNFVLIQKQGDVGETIRYVIDGRDMTTITGDGSGDLVSVNMVGDPSLSEHQFYIIKTG